MNGFNTARNEYERYINEGFCPCCFPHWEYPGLSIQDVWGWQDELNAWDVYAGKLDEDE